MKTDVATIPKSLIIDLIPAYLADDISLPTRQIIEQYAEQDPEIENMLNQASGATDLPITPVPPDKRLQHSTLQRIRRRIRKQMLLVAVFTSVILMIPWIAMRFTDEVNWQFGDFAVMAGLLVSVGSAFVWITGLNVSNAFKLGCLIGIVILFLLTWISLAVGIT